MAYKKSLRGDLFCPNVQGSQIITDTPNGRFLALTDQSYNTGALTYVYDNVNVASFSTNEVYGLAGIRLDAKRDNAIYTNNGRVCPRALLLNYTIKV